MDNLIKEISKYAYCYSGSGMLTNDVDEETQLKNAKKILEIVEKSLNKRHIRIRRESGEWRIETGISAGQTTILSDDCFIEIIMGMDNVFPDIKYNEDVHGRKEEQRFYNEIKKAYEQNKMTKYSNAEYEALKNEIISKLKEYGRYGANNISPDLYPLYENIHIFFKREGFTTSLTALRTKEGKGATLEITF